MRFWFIRDCLSSVQDNKIIASEEGEYLSSCLIWSFLLVANERLLHYLYMAHAKTTYNYHKSSTNS